MRSRVLCGEVAEEDAAISTTQHCLACRTSCCEIAGGFAHQLDLGSSQAFDLESELPFAMAKSPVFGRRILMAFVL